MIWKDPPVAPPRYLKYADNADELRANPKRWGMIVRPSTPSAKDFAWRVCTGRVKAFTPAGDFDAVSDGRNVHICFLGDGEFGE